MERADWLQAGLQAAQARFLMVTAITHHRFGSPAWGAAEVRKLHAELAEIDAAAVGVIPVSKASRLSRARPAARSLTAGPAMPVGPALMARPGGATGASFPVMRPAGYLPFSCWLNRLVRRLRSAFRRAARGTMASTPPDSSARSLPLGH